MRAASTASEARRVRGEVAARLRSRRGEIEEAVLTRVNAIGDVAKARDPTYAIGLHAAVGVAIEHGVETLGGGGDHPPPIPVALLAQARLAARNGVSLDVVLRRYFAGFTLFNDFLLQEAVGLKLPSSELKALFAAQGVLLNGLVDAVCEEYARESSWQPATNKRRRAELIERLLAGEQVDPTPLAYRLEACHVGIVASGPTAASTIRSVAARLDCGLLLLPREDNTVWAWLGVHQPPEDIYGTIANHASGRVGLACGEPGNGLSGWRLTHRQAIAALPIAERDRDSVVRYIDVALLASALRDDLLATSLHARYLAPLDASRDKGRALRQTLHAYFETGRNVSATAARLGISRQTVRSRLRAVEHTLGNDLDRCAADFDVALRLGRLQVDGLDLPVRPIY